MSDLDLETYGPTHGASYWRETNPGSPELEAIVAEIKALRPDFQFMVDMRHDPVRWFQGRWTHAGQANALIGPDERAGVLLKRILRNVRAADEAFEANRSKAV